MARRVHCLYCGQQIAYVSPPTGRPGWVTVPGGLMQCDVGRDSGDDRHRIAPAA